MIQVHAYHCAGPFSKFDHRRTDHIKGDERFMTLCVSNHYGVSEFFSSIQRCAQCFKTRSVELRNCHVILFGNGTYICEIY